MVGGGESERVLEGTQHSGFPKATFRLMSDGGNAKGSYFPEGRGFFYCAGLSLSISCWEARSYEACELTRRVIQPLWACSCTMFLTVAWIVSYGDRRGVGSVWPRVLQGNGNTPKYWFPARLTQLSDAASLSCCCPCP